MLENMWSVQSSSRCSHAAGPAGLFRTHRRKQTRQKSVSVHCVNGKGREAIPSHSSCCRAYYSTPTAVICISPISIYRHQPCKKGFFLCLFSYSCSCECLQFFSLQLYVWSVGTVGKRDRDRGGRARKRKEILDLHAVVHIYIIILGDNLMHTTSSPSAPPKKTHPPKWHPPSLTNGHRVPHQISPLQLLACYLHAPTKVLSD